MNLTWQTTPHFEVHQCINSCQPGLAIFCDVFSDCLYSVTCVHGHCLFSLSHWHNTCEWKRARKTERERNCAQYSMCVYENVIHTQTHIDRAKARTRARTRPWVRGGECKRVCWVREGWENTWEGNRDREQKKKRERARERKTHTQRQRQRERASDSEREKDRDGKTEREETSRERNRGV